MAAILDFWSELFFFYFWSSGHPKASYSASSQLAFRFRRRSMKNRCSRWLPIGMIVPFLYLQVTPIPPTKFQVSWRFGSGEEAKNRFSRCPPSWISDRNNFRYIDLQVSLILPTKFRVNWPFASGEEANKSTACGCQRSAANSKSKRGITVPKIFWGLPPLLVWVPLFIMNN